jgi:hypothetical protein
MSSARSPSIKHRHEWSKWWHSSSTVEEGLVFSGVLRRISWELAKGFEWAERCNGTSFFC